MLVAKPEDLGIRPTGPTWRKERTDSHKVSSDLHMLKDTCMYAHAHNKCKQSNLAKI